MRSSETNMEHYRNEILEILENGYHDFSLREDGSFASCGGMNCDDCVFGAEKTKVNCCKAKTLWMMEEYKPEITLTVKEKRFLEIAETGWITKDEDGEIKCHISEPIKMACYWTSSDEYYNLTTHKELFPFIKWEDEEPWIIEDLRKLKVEDE